MGALAGVPQQRYSEERIEEGLQALALHGSSMVAEELTGIPNQTLRQWRRTRAERLAEIRKDVLPAIRSRMAAQVEDNASLALEKAHDAMTELDTSSLSSAEKAKAVQQLAVATGVYVDKSNALRGLPAFTVEHATAEEVLRRLKGASPEYTIDSTAEEITDAEEVETPEAVQREPAS